MAGNGGGLGLGIQNGMWELCLGMLKLDDQQRSSFSESALWLSSLGFPKVKTHFSFWTFRKPEVILEMVLVMLCAEVVEVRNP